MRIQLREPDETDQPEGNIPGEQWTREDALKAVGDPRYKTDPAYQKYVQKQVEKMDGRLLGVGVEPDRIDGAAHDARIEWVRKAFSDPRYKSSAMYRQEVQTYIRQNLPELEARFGGQPEHTRYSIKVEPQIPGPDAPENPARAASQWPDDMERK